MYYIMCTSIIMSFYESQNYIEFTVNLCYILYNVFYITFLNF